MSAAATDALFSVGPLAVTEFTATSWGIMAVLTVGAFTATRNIQKNPTGYQNVVEFLIEGLYGFFEGMLGPQRIKRYFPLLCTFFLFILFSNYIGLLPMAGSGLYIPPTATLSVTAALAAIAVLSVHVSGVMTNGLAYFKHFVQPMPFMLPLNIVEEIVKPVSLAFRLYGNIFGHELVVHTLMGLSPWFVPVVIQMLGTLTGGIQAFVFTLLAATYLAGATEQHH